MALIDVVHRNIGRGVYRGEWVSAFAGSDTGKPFNAPQFPFKTVEVSGTFDLATLKIKGSNDNVTYFDLHDPQGNALTFTVGTGGGIERIAENPLFIRPETTGGNATALTVTITATSDGVGSI